MNALWSRNHSMSARTERRPYGVLAMAAGLVGIAVIVLLAIILYAIAIRERGVGFPYDATTGPYKIRERVGARQALNAGICRCAPAKNVRLRIPEGFETSVSIYDRGGRGRRPGVLIIHGNTWLGRNLSTYRLLASALADNGFIVLTFDQFGFGESDDPFGRGPASVAAASGFGVINAALDYLIEHTPVDSDGISVVGHSGGVDPAIAVGLARPEIARIVVMVAPPPSPGGAAAETEESKIPGTEEYEKERGQYFSQRALETHRFIYGRGYPDWYSWELTGAEEAYAQVNDANATLRKPGHKPVMLLLGERDQPTGHAYVLNEFNLWAQPKDLLVLKRADHYLNTAQSLGFVFYDRTLARALTEGLVPWLQGPTTH